MAIGDLNDVAVTLLADVVKQDVGQPGLRVSIVRRPVDV